MKGLVAQPCLTLCDLMDCSLPRSSAHGILQAKILEWVAMPSSRGSYQPRDRICVSCIVGRFLYSLSLQGSHINVYRDYTYIHTHWKWDVIFNCFNYIFTRYLFLILFLKVIFKICFACCKVDLQNSFSMCVCVCMCVFSVLFIYLFFLLYNIVLVLPYIDMNLPWVYICSPLPTFLPIPSLWVIPVHQSWAPCIMHRNWTGDSFHIW